MACGDMSKLPLNSKSWSNIVPDGRKEFWANIASFEFPQGCALAYWRWSSADCAGCPRT